MMIALMCPECDTPGVSIEMETLKASPESVHSSCQNCKKEILYYLVWQPYFSLRKPLTAFPYGNPAGFEASSADFPEFVDYPSAIQPRH